MIYLSKLIKELNLYFNSLHRGIVNRKVLYVFFILLLAIPYCFHKGVLPDVQLYNMVVVPIAESLIPPEVIPPIDVRLILGVLTVSPSDGSNVVVPNTDIEIKFNDNINMLTVDMSTVKLNGGSIGGVFTYDSQINTVIFTPDYDLAASTLYTVDITTGVKNLADDAMPAGFLSSFTTGLALNPEIYVVSPLDIISSGYVYDFGNMEISSTRSVVFTIGNSGNKNLDITELSLTSDDIDEFIISVNPVSPVVPSGSAVFTVDITPAAAGVKNAVITILSNDPVESSYVINLTGLSESIAVPEIDISVRSTHYVSGVSVYRFGTVWSGYQISRSLKISNIGIADLVITGYTISGNNPDDFSIDFSPMPCTIPPGTSKIINIIFKPGSRGLKYADVIFQNNDPDESPFVLKLTGRGH